MMVTYKKDINHTYILFQGDMIHTETFQVQMLLHNLVEGLLPCSMVSMNEEEIWRCECTGMPSLDVFCKTKELGKDDFIWIIHQLLENIQELQDYLLDVNNLYLLPEYIYIHPEKNKILCCLVPFYHNDIWSSLKQILQFLLQYLNPQDNGAASMAYGFFRMLSKEDCSMEILWAFLYEKKYPWKMGKGPLDENLEQMQLSEFLKDADFAESIKKDVVRYEQKDSESDIGNLLIDYRQKGRGEKPEPPEISPDNYYENIEREDKHTKEKLLDQIFFEKDTEIEGEESVSWIEKLKDKNFWKKIAYLFPAMLAIFLFLYLVFNSWTMSGTTLLTYAGTIVGFQIVSVILYWFWGREIEEVNPILLEYEAEEHSEKPYEPQKRARKNFRDRKQDSDRKQEENKKKEYYKTQHTLDSWSEEFEKKLFDRRAFGFADEDDCTVLLQQMPDQKRFLCRIDTNERYELREGETILGKSKERAQILLAEPTVSRIHAMITKQGDVCCIQDLNSKNGTYINGERLSIRSNYVLKAEDEIAIADVRFVLK